MMGKISLTMRMVHLDQDHKNRRRTERKRNRVINESQCISLRSKEERLTSELTEVESAIKFQIALK